jgi:hypothetical protein
MILPVNNYYSHSALSPPGEEPELQNEAVILLKTQAIQEAQGQQKP